MEALNWQLAPVYSRAAIDQLYSSDDKFKKFTNVQLAVAEIADDVQRGFSTMIGSVLVVYV